MVVAEGMSDLSGEVPYGRVTEAEDPETLVRDLFRVDRRGGRDPKPFLPRVALRALTESARQDPKIREVLLGLGYSDADHPRGTGRDRQDHPGG